MITALISLYTTATLLGSDLPITPQHTMPWNNSNESQSTSLPIKKAEAIAPVIKSKSAIAVDLQSGVILFEKNIYEPLPIASITKLMTAIITLEENEQADVVTVSRSAAKTIGSKAWLAAGEKITVESLLYAVLIHSANDAAEALAEYNSKDIKEFVIKMNTKSKELGLIATHFYNPTGLDETEIDTTTIPATTKTNDNYSTAYDLTLLGRYAFENNFIKKAVKEKTYVVYSSDETLEHKLTNTNELLKSYLKVLGLKTGTTDEAGECLIAIIESDDGHDILTVVLNSPSRYSESKILADWVFRSYTWKKHPLKT